MQAIYAALCVFGIFLPWWAFLPWFSEHDLALPLLLQHALASPVSAFAWLDVLLSAVVLLVFMGTEGRRLGMTRLWLPVLGLCVVGVSLGLPLFLLMRERHLAARA